MVVSSSLGTNYHVLFLDVCPSLHGFNNKSGFSTFFLVNTFGFSS